MNSTIWKGIETFLIGLAVVIVGGIIQALTNYHPQGNEAGLWSIFGVALIGGFRALLSWLIVRQGSNLMQSNPPPTTSAPGQPPSTGSV